MKLAVRIALYVALLLFASLFFAKFRAAYQTAPAMSRAGLTDEPAVTNAAPEVAEATATNAPAATNAVAEATTDLAVTNEVEAAATNVVAASTNPPAATPAGANPPGAATRSGRGTSSVVYLGGFLACLLGAAGLGAWDVVNYLGSRAGRSVMAEDYIDRKDPEYDAAEEEWTNGNHLEAVRLMREYLKKNPNEQHVAIRIAEIYEKDLGNHLAAALELEEVLNTKLPREKWGWTAIRLSNLYSGRLNQPNKALDVLNRIVRDYPETAAAAKARNRLGIPEPASEATAEAAPEPEEAEEPSSPPPPPEEPPANLPKGFRPKK